MLQLLRRSCRPPALGSLLACCPGQPGRSGESATDHLQHWAHLRQHGGIPADQDREGASQCSFRAAGDGGTKVVDADLLQLSGGLLRPLGLMVEQSITMLPGWRRSADRLGQTARFAPRVIADAQQQNVDIVRRCGWVDAASRAGELQVVFGSTVSGVHLQA